MKKRIRELAVRRYMGLEDTVSLLQHIIDTTDAPYAVTIALNKTESLRDRYAVLLGRPVGGGPVRERPGCDTWMQSHTLASAKRKIRTYPLI